MIRKKSFYDLGGTLRSRPPEETLAWVKPKLSEFGITRVANVTGLDQIGIYVTNCIRPNSKHLSVSQGKGITLQLAEISAIMESIEGYHIENPRPPELYGTFNNLSLEYDLINPLRFNRTLFAGPQLLDQTLGWTKTLNLVNGESCYIPHILTCIDSTVSRPEYSFLKVSSNGLSAGNTEKEAICHALLEVIERDSHASWQGLPVEMQEKTQIDVFTVDSEINRSLIDQFYAADIYVNVWEITSSDLNIPAFHCAIYDPNVMRGLSLFSGTGAHLSKEIALSRALTEAAQSRLTFISGQRDDIFPTYYQQVGSQASSINPADIRQGLKSYPSCSHVTISNDFLENQNKILEALKLKGMEEVLLVNHTKPEFEVPVVQVIVPGFLFNSERMR